MTRKPIQPIRPSVTPLPPDVVEAVKPLPGEIFWSELKVYNRGLADRGEREGLGTKAAIEDSRTILVLTSYRLLVIRPTGSGGPIPLDRVEFVSLRQPRLIRFWRPRPTIIEMSFRDEIEMSFRDESLGPTPVTVEWITAPPELAVGFVEQLLDNQASLTTSKAICSPKLHGRPVGRFMPGRECPTLGECASSVGQRPCFL